MSLVLAVLVASLLGSVHCAAMCGAFVCFYSAASTTPTRWQANLTGHAAYNMGRAVSYVSLGLLAGSLGGAMNHTAGRFGLGGIAALVAGTLMMLWGVATLLTARGVHGVIPTVPTKWRHAMGAVLLQVRSQPPVTRAAVTGLVTTLLPCGWLYAFVVTAGGSGSALRGGLVMLVFWAGTLPMMLSVGFGAQRLFGPLRQKLPALSAAMVVLVGFLSIANHFGWLPGMEWMHTLPLVPTADGLAGVPSSHMHP